MKVMDFKLQHLFFFLWWTMLILAYCYTFGFPATWQQVLYTSFFVGVLGAVIIGVFMLTLLVFGLPIPDVFRRKKK